MEAEYYMCHMRSACRGGIVLECLHNTAMAQQKSSTKMTLQDCLYEQGFGTRRVCAGMVQQGHVRVQGQHVSDPLMEVEGHGLSIEVLGEAYVCHMPAYLILHKPAGYEVSQKPKHHPSVYSLLPAALRQRPSKGTPGVQAVGRLDEDTTGLLLMSDDGQFIHKMSSPKHHVPKVYEVSTVHPLGEAQVRRLIEGVVLDDDPKPVRAEAAEIVSERHLRMTLTQGKYHQVKRMLAAVSNRVDRLHRSEMGTLQLGDLPVGQWRWLTDAEVQGLRAKRS